MGAHGSKYEPPTVTHRLSYDWQSMFHGSFKHWWKKTSTKLGFDKRVNYNHVEEYYHACPWACENRTLMIQAKIWLSTPENDCTFTQSPRLYIGEKDGRGRDTWWRIHNIKFSHGYSLKRLVKSQTGPGRKPNYNSPAADYQGCNIIGTRDDIVIIQLSFDNRDIKLLIVKKCDTYYETIIMYNYQEYFCLLEATISPDYNKFLLRPRRSDSLQVPNSKIQLFFFNKDKCAHMRDILFGESETIVYAFDPRYQWRRLAIGYQGDKAEIQLINIATDEMLCRSDAGSRGNGLITAQTLQRTEKLVYSPDGRFLASLVSKISFVSDSLVTMAIAGVLVYNSNNLDVIHAVSVHEGAPHLGLSSFENGLRIKAYKALLIPEFSLNGRYLAIPRVKSDLSPNNSHDDGSRFDSDFIIDVYSVPTILRLTELCRAVICLHMSKGAVDQLPALPLKLKSFLNFRPMYK